MTTSPGQVPTVSLRDTVVAQGNAMQTFESASPLPMLPLAAFTLAFGTSIPAGVTIPNVAAALPGLPAGFGAFQFPTLPGLPGLPAPPTGLAPAAPARPADQPAGIKTTRI